MTNFVSWTSNTNGSGSFTFTRATFPCIHDLSPGAFNSFEVLLETDCRVAESRGSCDAAEIPLPRKADPLPAILSQDEVARLLTAVPDRKMRTLLTTVYAAGLRVSEVVGLQVGDIDSARMTIHVREGKGGRDRHVMLSPQLLAILRAHWRRTRPPSWLFPGPDPSRPITARSVQRACCQAVETAGLDKSVTVHTLRHSFATHLLEQGVDIRVIQHLLGHRHIASTTRYARVALNTIRQVKSPLELLDLGGPPPA